MNTHQIQMEIYLRIIMVVEHHHVLQMEAGVVEMTTVSWEEIAAMAVAVVVVNVFFYTSVVFLLFLTDIISQIFVVMSMFVNILCIVFVYFC